LKRRPDLLVKAHLSREDLNFLVTNGFDIEKLNPKS
jgi:hypothetical protein